MRDFGERGRKLMKKVNYTDEKMELKVIKDFLPEPEDLVLREKKKRVTLMLSQESLDYFKSEARKHGASYQSMIRELIDYYVSKQSV